MIFTAIFLALLSCCDSRLIFHTGSNLLKGFSLNYTAPSLRFQDHFWNTGLLNLTIADPIDACDDLQNDVSGRAVFVALEFGDDIIRCSQPDKIRRVQRAGAAAMLFLAGDQGFYGASIRWDGLSDVDLHAVEFLPEESFQKELEAAFGSGELIQVAIEPDTPSNYEKLLDKGLAMFLFSGVMITMSSISLTITLYKLYGYLFYASWSRYPLVIGILILEMISNSIRIVSLVDPFFVSGIYPGQVGQVLLTANFPFMISGTLLLAFFWEELLKKSTVTAIPSLRRLRYVAGVTLVVIFFLVYSASATRAGYFHASAIYVVSSVIQGAISIGVGIFFMSAGLRVIGFIRRGQNMRLPEKTNQRRRNLQRVTRLLCVCGSAMIIYGLLVFLFEEVRSRSAFGFYVYAVFLWGSHEVIALTSVLVFSRPKRADRDSSSSPSQTNI